MPDSNYSLRRLSDASDVAIAPDEHDISGWDVLDGDHQEIGEVEELIVDTGTMKVRYLEIDLDSDLTGFDDDRRVVVPITLAQLDPDEHHVLLSGIDRDQLQRLPTFDTLSSSGDTSAQPSSYASAPRPTANTTEGQQRITRSAEELRVGKREVAAGEVRVGKHVETERVRTPVTIEEERVTIERRPVSGEMRADAHIGDAGEIVVPVVEEEVVVDKRAVVKEELVIGKERVSRTETVETDVRREEFDIDERGDVNVSDRGSDRRPPTREGGR